MSDTELHLSKLLQHYKTLLLLQVAADRLQTSPEIFSMVITNKVLLWIFEVLSLRFFSLALGPYGSEFFKNAMLPQFTVDYFETSPEFSSQKASQKSCFWIF